MYGVLAFMVLTFWGSLCYFAFSENSAKADIQIECYNKSKELIRKERVKSISFSADDDGMFHKCILTYVPNK